MSSIYRFTVALFFIVAVIHLSALPSFSTENEMKALQEKVNTLEKKLNRLEHNFDQRLQAVEKTVFPEPKRDSTLEKKAKEEINSIKKLISNEQISRAKAKLDDFFKKYSTTRFATSAGKLSQEISVIGMDAPKNWDIEKWFQGKDEIDLKKQNPMLLIFWETWCGFCQREVPKLQKTYTEYKDDGLQVIGFTKINRSATPEKVIEFIKENNITYPIAKENGSLSQYFKVQGIPAAALISKGKIVWRGNPARLPDQLIKKYLSIQTSPEHHQDKAKKPSAS